MNFITLTLCCRVDDFGALETFIKHALYVFHGRLGGWLALTSTVSGLHDGLNAEERYVL